MVDMWRSTIGKKTIVAVTGAFLLFYLLLHMAGNLNSLFGPGVSEARVDWYGSWLREFGEPLLPYTSVVWLMRILLLGSVLVHITGVVQLAARNRAARPAHFPAKRLGRSWESRLMMVSGTLLIAFIIFHILQFTTLTIDVTPLHHGEIYANLYNAFQEWYFVVIYLIATILIGIHLRHGIWSMTQTFGMDNEARNRKFRHGATAFTVILVIGFALVPVLMWTKVLDAPDAHGALINLTSLGGAFR
ncbi:MAG: succinate dehydrogenase cytochrome b subunit [Actinomycetota bacterium]|nr:succinate dehydrogenase cytochrome b subunit [Actinomycetota bacterium]